MSTSSSRLFRRVALFLVTLGAVTCGPDIVGISFRLDQLSLPKGPPSAFTVVHIDLLGLDGKAVDTAKVRWHPSSNPYAFGVIGAGDSAVVYSMNEETIEFDSIRVSTNEINAAYPISVISGATWDTIPNDCSDWPLIMGDVATTDTLSTRDCRLLRGLSLRFSDQFTVATQPPLTRVVVQHLPVSYNAAFPVEIHMDLHALLGGADIGWDGFKGKQDSFMIRLLTDTNQVRLRVEERLGRLLPYRLTVLSDDGTLDCTPIIASWGMEGELEFPTPRQCITQTGGNDPYQQFMIELGADTSFTAEFSFTMQGFTAEVQLVDRNGVELPYDTAASTGLTGNPILIRYPHPLHRSTSPRQVALLMRVPSRVNGAYTVGFHQLCCPEASSTR